MDNRELAHFLFNLPNCIRHAIKADDLEWLVDYLDHHFPAQKETAGKAYLIMETQYDSDYYGGSIDRPCKISFDKELAEKYAADNKTYRRAACGCCFTGYSYSVDEIDVLEKD